ncbi:uncharacterized protein PRCAT00000689001 [Priceomyces carsonii]|uniref:uncharacterized protein n=1 Tax=Priceomyces carsonii TaxID=28549 RepID=UPI002ED79681|nr:unnamed protein product [Priceomyces carsonii]
MSSDQHNDPLVFKTQLVLCLWAGISTFILFCILRFKWPHIYALRTLRRNTLKQLPNGVFRWVKVVYSITEDEVLEYSGLDAYVFLTFFKMGIKIFSLLALFAVFILSPIRYYFTGNYDKDDLVLSVYKAFFTTMQPPDFSDDFPKFLWVYPIFTYIFSIIVYTILLNVTKKVLKIRQKYLAAQDSITDRTIRLDGIPKKLLKKNSPDVLKRFIEDLGIGKVQDIKLIYDWTPLEKLFKQRKLVIGRLEELYSSLYQLKIDIFGLDKVPAVTLLHSDFDQHESTKRQKKQKEEIVNLAKKLIELDNSIKVIQLKYDPEPSTIDIEEDPEFKLLASAFITMDSVASAQMAAQTVLDPRVYKLIVSLAPAPKDIKWENFKLTYYQKLIKAYLITFVVILSYTFNSVLVTPLTTLLDLKTLTKLWPALGNFISQSTWLTTFVTGILPPLLFSMLNISLPYFYKFLSQYQGYSSNSDVELATLLKNFFFVFFNLFLVFIVTGTFWDYISYISDTTKIAYQLARSLRKQSLFYVDLILLQGLAMFPIKLLQIGDFLIANIIGKLFFLRRFILKTPRDYRFYYYTPPIFDFGIQLPQHMLIFIIILIYSVVSTKIVTSGLVYFILGHFVYKYQLVYNFVHPPHSTGKVWPMVFRRVMLGLLIFQLFMCGSMALEGAILLSALCTPLVVVTLVFEWNFERNYLPLNTFIALRAIQNPYDFDKEFDDDSLLVSTRTEGVQEDESSSDLDQTLDETSHLMTAHSRASLQGQLSRRRSTIDEEREQFTDYTYPLVIDSLDGPCIGFDGDYISVVEYDKSPSVISNEILESGEYSIVPSSLREIVLRKRYTVSEWE